jgi:hypothetical protein
VPATTAAPPPAFLVAHWLRLDPPGGTPPAEVVRERVAAAPGETGQATLRLAAPELAGTYLLVLDVVSPLHGSLVAAGEDPAIVRVTVAWPPADPVRDFLPTPAYVPAPDLVEAGDAVEPATPATDEAPSPGR